MVSEPLILIEMIVRFGKDELLSLECGTMIKRDIVLRTKCLLLDSIDSHRLLKLKYYGELAGYRLNGNHQCV